MKAQQPDIATVLAALHAGYQADVDVHAFAELDSTSSWLSQKRAVLSEALEARRSQICLTDWQQAGVGRRGKVWQTRPGNITVSLLSRAAVPAQSLLGLSLVTGIAVAEALEEAFGIHVMLKWPNDLIYENRKLGGLLTQLQSAHSNSGNSLPDRAVGGEQSRKMLYTDVITGVGVNVFHDDEVQGLGIGATSLNQAGIDISPLERDGAVGKLCANVLSSHEHFVSHGWASFEQRWAKRDWLFDKKVSIHRDESTEHAVACGVNEQGALLVESAGKLTELYGGNVSIRPTE